MTNNNKQNWKPVIIAAIVAAILLLASNTVYSVLYNRLTASVDTIAMTSEDMQKLPLKIGDWAGKEVPLKEEVVVATDTDAHVNRSYSRFSDHVVLYIAYGVKARDLMPHRPEVCYTGAGWNLDDKSSAEIPLSSDTNLTYTLMQFSRGGLNAKKTIVLNYYIVDGQYCSDVSLLRSKAWKGSGTIGYVAQVQIVTAAVTDSEVDSAIESARSFAAESAAHISGLFEKSDSNTALDQSTPEGTSQGGDND
jgi:EpsI family protein